VDGVFVAEVPAGVVTLTLVAPAERAGATALIWVSEFTVKLVALVVPKRT
jgi:hypothetical protein